MSTPIAFAGALGAVIIGDGVILILERALLSFDTKETKRKSVIGAESSLGFWGSLIFVFVLVGLIYALVRVVLPILNIAHTSGNFLIIGGGAFALGIVLNLYRKKDVPPPFITTIIIFSLVTVVYSVGRWLFSEVVMLPTAATQSGVFVIGLVSAILAVSMVIDETSVTASKGDSTTGTTHTPVTSEESSHRTSIDKSQENSRASSGGWNQAETTSSSNQRDTGVHSDSIVSSSPTPTTIGDTPRSDSMTSADTTT